MVSSRDMREILNLEKKIEGDGASIEQHSLRADLEGIFLDAVYHPRLKYGQSLQQFLR